MSSVLEANDSMCLVLQQKAFHRVGQITSTCVPYFHNSKSSHSRHFYLNAVYAKKMFLSKCGLKAPVNLAMRQGARPGSKRFKNEGFCL